MQSNRSVEASFDQAKLFVFKFLTHQLHPYAFAIKAFLQPALEECLRLMSQHPADTFNVLLSIARTLISFAPDEEFIYDEVQQFAIQLKATLDQCSAHVDPQTIRQSSEVLEAIRPALLAMIHQENNNRSPFVDMYKNLSAVLANLERIHATDTKVERLFVDETETLVSKVNTKEHADTVDQKSTLRSASSTPLDDQVELVPSTEDSVELLMKSLMHHTEESSYSTSTSSVTTSSSSQLISTTSTDSANEGFLFGPSLTREPMIDLSNTSPYDKGSHLPAKSTITEQFSSDIEPLPLPSHACSSLHEILAKDYPWLSSELDDDSENKLPSSELRRTPIRYDASQSSICAVSSAQPTNDEYELGIELSRPAIPWSEWYPTDDQPSTTIERYDDDPIASVHSRHITDEYLKQWRNDSDRPILRGELSLTYGRAQNGPQTSCMPIGVALSDDESTLLSCDVHRTAQSVRLFDIRTGQCKRTIGSTQKMQLHRPSAVLGYANDTIVIVERETIHIVGSDGHWINTFSHPSIRQLYGIALFRDRYLLTLDSRATSKGRPETCRLLFFDPRNGQLILQQPIVINRQSKMFLEQQEIINYIQGSILPESASKPRFLAVHDEHIYIADLGRSLIYGTSLANPAEFTYIAVFGGHGQDDGQMIDPSGLCTDTGGNIISADSKNDRIQLFSSNGEYRAALELDAPLKRPSGICTNRAGTQLYVSCYLAGCVRAFNLDY